LWLRGRCRVGTFLRLQSNSGGHAARGRDRTSGQYPRCASPGLGLRGYTRQGGPGRQPQRPEVDVAPVGRRRESRPFGVRPSRKANPTSALTRRKIRSTKGASRDPLSGTTSSVLQRGDFQVSRLHHSRRGAWMKKGPTESSKTSPFLACPTSPAPGHVGEFTRRWSRRRCGGHPRTQGPSRSPVNEVRRGRGGAKGGPGHPRKGNLGPDEGNPTQALTLSSAWGGGTLTSVKGGPPQGVGVGLTVDPVRGRTPTALEPTYRHPEPTAIGGKTGPS